MFNINKKYYNESGVYSKGGDTMSVNQELIELMADEILKMVTNATEQKKLTPRDLFSAMIQLHKKEGATKKEAQAALKILTDCGDLVYTYFNGTYVEFPHKEGAAND